MDKTPRIAIPAQMRRYVFDRDQNRCQSCGATSELSIDHIVPLANGGTDDISNLQTLCCRWNSIESQRQFC
ncbi:MAG: HNH endonuclease [Leptolyngbyaceae cyanobacterium SM1_3_5]|nr:HNH endonuclease [Leptolyngbyaceae cyanobacterium SM1_3_5]